MFNCVYSLGVDCRTEIALKQLNLKKFSYVFGNINSKNLTNVKFHIQDNFKFLLNNKHHLCINDDTNLFMTERLKYGPRTFHINYDDVDNFHDATFAHHDLSLKSTQQHFERSVDTFNKINNKSIPTLYVCMAGRELNTPIEHCMNLVNMITTLNKNAFVLILNLFSVSTNLIPFYKDNKCSIYSEINKGPDGNVELLNKILSTFHLSNLFSKEMIE